MEDILNATLAGGVAIGSSAAILYYPGVSLVIGMTAGAISTFGFKYLSAILVNKFKLNDTCGIHNLHGIPGVFGGFVSALIVAGYNTGYDINVAAQYGPANIFASVHGTYINQAGLQIAGTLTSVGLGIVFGSLAGLAINFFYEEQP
jgi:ammonium transporter Rh